MESFKKNKLSGFFVTGTDTGVGKTAVAVALMEQLRAKGQTVVGFKPVATGAVQLSGHMSHPDVIAIQGAASVGLATEVVNPYSFEPAIAPHLAAGEQGVCMTVAEIKGKLEAALTADIDAVVVEGAGGWLVPLNEHETLADLACALSLPVVLVVAIRLGCLNHTLLTYENMMSRSVPIAGWVANQVDPNVVRAQEQVMALQQRMSCPLLASFPYEPGKKLSFLKSSAQPLASG